MLVWSEAWNAKGEKGQTDCYFKHTPNRGYVRLDIRTRSRVNRSGFAQHGDSLSDDESRLRTISAHLAQMQKSRMVNFALSRWSVCEVG